MSYAHARDAAKESHAKRVGRYARGGAATDEAQDRKEVAAAVHKHERHDHKGEPLTKLRGGGEVEGKRARGGRLDRKKGTTVNIVLAGQGQDRPVPVPVKQPVPVPVGAAPGGPPGGPPMMPHPPVAGMGPPPGGPPMMPPRKRGGAVKRADGGDAGGKDSTKLEGGHNLQRMPYYREGEQQDAKRGGRIARREGGAVKMTAGAASGEGRLEKAEMEGGKVKLAAMAPSLGRGKR